MYQVPYADVLADDFQRLRRNEETAFSQVIEKLEFAQQAGPGSIASVEALYYADKLWKILLEDLAHADNALPDELKANLISIGIWMLKEIDAVRSGERTGLNSMIEINRIIREGLRQE